MCSLIEQEERENSFCQKEREVSAYRESSWKVCQSRLCQKKKEQSRLSRAPNRKGEGVKLNERRTLAREKKIRARAWKGKKEIYREGRQIPRR